MTVEPTIPTSDGFPVYEGQKTDWHDIGYAEEFIDDILFEIHASFIKTVLDAEPTKVWIEIRAVGGSPAFDGVLLYNAYTTHTHANGNEYVRITTPFRAGHVGSFGAWTGGGQWRVSPVQPPAELPPFVPPASAPVFSGDVYDWNSIWKFGSANLFPNVLANQISLALEGEEFLAIQIRNATGMQTANGTHVVPASSVGTHGIWLPDLFDSLLWTGGGEWRKITIPPITTNEWNQVVSYTVKTVNTARIIADHIGAVASTSANGLEFTGVANGEALEHLAFKNATVINQNEIEINNLAEHGYPLSLTAPIAPTALFTGMWRQATGGKRDKRIAVGYDRAVMTDVISNGHQIGFYEARGIATNNRATMHKKEGADDWIISATLPTDSMIEMIAIADIKLSSADKLALIDATVRITGTGSQGVVDVTYPLLAPTYSLLDRPHLSWSGLTLSGHKLDKLNPHFVGLVPLMYASSLQVKISGHGGNAMMSTLFASPVYRPDEVGAGNMDYGSIVDKQKLTRESPSAGLKRTETIGTSKKIKMVLKMSSPADSATCELIRESDMVAVLGRPDGTAGEQNAYRNIGRVQQVAGQQRGPVGNKIELVFEDSYR